MENLQCAGIGFRLCIIVYGLAAVYPIAIVLLTPWNKGPRFAAVGYVMRSCIFIHTSACWLIFCTC